MLHVGASNTEHARCFTSGASKLAAISKTNSVSQVAPNAVPHFDQQPIRRGAISCRCMVIGKNVGAGVD